MTPSSTAQSPADILFQPFRLKTLELKNRIVMAPMTRNFSPNGIPDGAVADYYTRRAAADVGLILSEGTTIARPAAKNLPQIPSFHGAALDGWKRVIDAVHGAGGKMGPQIWHVGSVPGPGTDWTPDGAPESPSGLVAPGAARGVAMSDEDIADTIAAFGAAARAAKTLGFDTFELHGAHGYLIDQFFWDGTNRRDDRWGGATLAQRSRFAAEVVKAARAAVGPDFPIILRLSQWKQQDYDVKLAADPDAMTQWLLPLVEAGADVLHCSQRRFWEAEFPEIDGEQGLNFAGWAKKLTGAATISVGSVGLDGEFLSAFAGKGAAVAHLDGLLARMERGEFDLIAVGRALLADPQWAAKVKAGDQAGLTAFEPKALATLS
ncbi:NADH:flavin oxidoreductase [Massilia forsythiae]|uniref:NADH:flavin oxidoreductase n=1 Tax=Massilia forsythiae TaxID=2728020 RepID=A0A7Z2VWC3_9BURK|nr:NADH:flavin oxidoreductase [Massilia forsythiae]QJE00527.1 NADH:flavin oxidoreductase [Massilia forsythiae]